MFSDGGTTGTRLGPRFHQLWTAVTVSSLGDGMRFVALPLLAARLTSDPRQIAAVSFAEQAPWLLLGLVSGALADRFDRRRILWTMDAARTVVVAAVALAVATGTASVPVLAAAGFLLGCGQTLYAGGWSGMVPALVEPRALTRANARLQAGSLITDTLLGTPLGALLFGLAAALPFLVDAASFAAAATLVLLLSGDFRPRPQAGHPGLAALRRDTAEGVRWLWRHHLLRRLCLVSAVSNLVGGGLIAILVLYARDALGLSGLGFALMVAVFAIGGVAGATATPGLTARFGPARVLRLAVLTTAVAAAAIGDAGSGPVAGLFIAVYGVADLAWSVTAISQRQSLVPGELLGRVSMAYQMITGGAVALGTVAAGLSAREFGLRAPFFAGAVLLAAAGLVSTRPGPNPRPAAVPQPQAQE